MIGLASQSTRTSNFYCDPQGKCTWSVWSVTWISFLDLKAPQRLRLSQMSLPWDRDATLDGCGLNFGMCHRLALPFTALQEFERTTKFVRCVFNRTLWLVYLVSICILSICRFEADQDALSKVYRSISQRTRKTQEYHTPPRGIGNEALQRSTTSVSCHVAR